MAEENGKSCWILEIGPGKGEFILNQAQENPHTNFAAVELKRGRFEKISRKIAQLELQNLFLVRGDARECLPRVFPQGLFDKIYILFPDPWPKKRHAKHRLLKPRLVNQLHELLKPGGEILSATDAGFYSEQIVASFEAVGNFVCKPTESPYPTYFEKKWRAAGRNIDYWRFIPSRSL
jgi:tRNA (guanine-N7-)-methyltransferase